MLFLQNCHPAKQAVVERMGACVTNATECAWTHLVDTGELGEDFVGIEVLEGVKDARGLALFSLSFHSHLHSNALNGESISRKWVS